MTTGRMTAAAPTWAARTVPSFGSFLNHLAPGLTLAVFVCGTAADRLVRAEQYTAQDSATGLFLLTWGLGWWAAITWLGAAWQLLTTWHRRSRSTLGPALLELMLTAGLFAIAFEAWKPFGSAWG